MNHRAISVRNATLAALALSLTLSACAPANEEAGMTPAPSVTATETATVTPSSTSKPTPSMTVKVEPSAAPVTPVAPAPAKTIEPKPAVPKLVTFTFPDGHISFDLPANWTIKTQQGPYLDYEKEIDKAKSIEAHIYDETGNKVAVIASGGYGGGAAGPEFLTVLDSQAIPTLPPLTKGGDAVFAFIQYNNPHDHAIRYFMGNINTEYVTNGEGTSGSPYLLLDNGAAMGMVEFSTPAFTSLGNAKSWMNTKQYSQLKAMLTSMRYV